METENDMIALLKDIKGLLSHQKKVMNVDDLVAYTGLSKSKIYKLTQLRLIPMGGNKNIRLFVERRSNERSAGASAYGYLFDA